MNRIVKCVLLALFLVMLTPMAKADTVIWQDPDFGFHVSFPDRWRPVFDRPSPTRYVMVNPSKDKASCVVLAEKDRRFVTHNADEMGTVVMREINPAFWAEKLPFMNIYDNRPLDFNVQTIRNGSLAQAFARYVVAEYGLQSGETIKGIYFASIYADMMFVVGCQSEKSVFTKIQPTFMGVIHSVEFANKYRPFPTLYYRDFIGDPDL